MSSIFFNKVRSTIKGDLNCDLITLRVLFFNYYFNNSFRVLLNFRIGKYLSNSNSRIFRFIAKAVYRKRLNLHRSCFISYEAIIGRGVKFAHPNGIVIGEKVIIEDNVIIYHQVTIGSHGKKNEVSAYPIIKRGCKIFSGAKIFGGVVIGEDSIVGANSVVFVNVPKNSLAVGIPAKIISRD